MSLINLIYERFRSKEEETDLDKIQVSSSGDVFMDAEDLFDNNDESLELIEKLNSALEKYISKGNVSVSND